ncbi:MAG: hypothetical protein GKR86_02860, partial [Ilumatobacter sp.]|nr:hypothetical protein [Ilumatobacter sp.]
MVCGIFTVVGDDGEYETKVLGNHPDDGLEDMLEWMLTDESIKIVTQRGGFDYSVICRTFPRLIPLGDGRFVPAEEVIGAHLHTLFVGMVVEGW